MSALYCVDYDTLYKAILSSVQQYAALAASDEKKLINDILKANSESKNKSIQRHEKTIRESKNRIKEIDGLLQNLYEDKVAGEITAELFKRMSHKYGEEQTKLIMDVEQFENELNEYNCAERDLADRVERIKECLSINNLSHDVVVGLIDRVEVSETYSVDGETNLDISISYKLGRLSQKKRAC